MSTRGLDDFYDGVSEETKEILERMQIYTDLAIKQGDVIHSDKPGELTIKIRIKKKSDVPKDK